MELIVNSGFVNFHGSILTVLALQICDRNYVQMNVLFWMWYFPLKLELVVNFGVVVVVEIFP